VNCAVKRRSTIMFLFIVVVIAVSVHRKTEQDNDHVIQEKNAMEMQNQPWQIDVEPIKMVPRGKSTALMTVEELFGEEEPTKPEIPEQKLQYIEERSSSEEDNSDDSIV